MVVVRIINEAIDEALKLKLNGNHFYYCLLAELYRLKGETTKEILYLNKALELPLKQSERDMIILKLKKASQ